MARLLIVDDAEALTNLFGRAITESLGHEVVVVSHLDGISDLIDPEQPFDLAVVDLSFPGQQGSGIDGLVEIRNHSPTTKLAIITQGDEWVEDILRDAWELLPITTVISKSAPLDYQLEAIRRVLRDGNAPIDPAIQPLIPSNRNPWRTTETFAALVPHAGHAKLWVGADGRRQQPQLQNDRCIGRAEAQHDQELPSSTARRAGTPWNDRPEPRRNASVRVAVSLVPAAVHRSGDRTFPHVNRASRSVLALGVGFVGATAIFQAAGVSPPGNDRAVVVGQIDTTAFCRSQFGDSSNAMLVGTSAYSWRCSDRSSGLFRLVEVDFTEACRALYGTSVRSNNWDESNPYAWECVED